MWGGGGTTLIILILHTHTNKKINIFEIMAISKGPILVKITLEEQGFIGLSFDLNLGSRSLHIIYPTSNYA